MYQDQLWWLGSNGLDLLSVGSMDNGPKVRSCQLNFPWPTAQKPACRITRVWKNLRVRPEPEHFKSLQDLLDLDLPYQKLDLDLRDLKRPKMRPKRPGPWRLSALPPKRPNWTWTWFNRIMRPNWTWTLLNRNET
jgi:hypothetical protein